MSDVIKNRSFKLLTRQKCRAVGEGGYKRSHSAP
jgi:hypothetical protein